MHLTMDESYKILKDLGYVDEEVYDDHVGVTLLVPSRFLEGQNQHDSMEEAYNRVCNNIADMLLNEIQAIEEDQA